MRIITTLIFCLVAGGLIAQSIDNSVVNTSGSTLNGEGITLDFSLGEVAIAYVDATQIIVSEGFLNGDEERVLTGLGNSLSFDMSVYPNPVEKLLTVSFMQNTKSAQVELVNLSGHELFTKQVEPGDQTFQLDVSDLKGGVYYLRTLSDDGKTSNAHKILILK